MSITSFSDLYEQLANSNTHIDLNKQVWSVIGRLGHEHSEMIYFLILHDFINNGGDTSKVLPYSSKTLTGGKGVLFTLDKLPERTQKIIVRYLSLISC